MPLFFKPSQQTAGRVGKRRLPYLVELLKQEVRSNEETFNNCCRRSNSVDNVDACSGRVCRNAEELRYNSARHPNDRSTTQASKAAQREAREGNKDNNAFARRSYEIDQLVERMKSGQQISQNQVDGALQPVSIW